MERESKNNNNKYKYMKDGDKYHGEKLSQRRGCRGEGYGNKQDGQEDPTERDDLPVKA